MDGMALVMNWQLLRHKVMRLVSQGNDLWHLTTILVLSYHTPSLWQTTGFDKYTLVKFNDICTSFTKISVSRNVEASYSTKQAEKCTFCKISIGKQLPRMRKAWGIKVLPRLQNPGLNTEHYIEEKGTRNQNLDTIAKTGSKFKEKLQQSISVSAN